jgi:phosphate starvation-inducible protein PhoH
VVRHPLVARILDAYEDYERGEEDSPQRRRGAKDD